MNKAVISNRIMLPVKDRPHEEAIIVNLTYKLEDEYMSRIKQREVAEVIRNYVRYPKGYFSIPTGRAELIPEDYEIVDNRSIVPVEFPKHNLVLRPSQQHIFDHISDSCIINAPVSWGKTYAAIAIASKFSQKTLVITHTTALRDQWISDIRKVLNIEPGIIGGGDWIGLDKPIIVANIQTLRKDVERISKMFGMVILDECLDYETQIDTNLGKLKLGSIVNNKKEVLVRSLNLYTGKEEFKPVVRWFKTPHTDCLQIFHALGSIKATPNHNIFVENNGVIEKKTADQLKVGDNLVFTVNRHKSSNKLNNKYDDVILGLLLGDGSLDRSANNIRLRITHGEDQLDYLLYKKKILSKIITADITDSKSGYSDKRVHQIQTQTFTDDLNLYEKIYRNNKKSVVTKDLIDKLSKRSWGFIYQDDGSINDRAITFSFCEFDDETLELLKHNLHTLFNIELDQLKIYKCNKGFNYLRINYKGSEQFLTQIKNFIHPVLYYKFGNFNAIREEADFSELETLEDLVLDYYTRPILKVSPSTLVGNHKFNIEVADNHNYYANGILVSNCHHVPATTFSDVIDKLWARYRIGLSGTIQRKDRKHVLFRDFFGPVLYQPEAENRVNPNVLIIKSHLRIPTMTHWAHSMTELGNNDEYRDLVSKLADAMADKGHRVLVISERVNFLEACARRSGDRACVITGSVRDFEERVDLMKGISNGEYDILYGSRAIFSEGISLNELSCLILACPINNNLNLEQLIGRIQRIVEGKRTPLVIDLNLADNVSKNQAKLRKSYYLSKGYKIYALDEK